MLTWLLSWESEKGSACGWGRGSLVHPNLIPVRYAHAAFRKLGVSTGGVPSSWLCALRPHLFCGMHLLRLPQPFSKSSEHPFTDRLITPYTLRVWGKHSCAYFWSHQTSISSLLPVKLFIYLPLLFFKETSV